MIDLKSWNPWHGCRKYSEGCANYYMFVLDKAHKVPGQSDSICMTRNMAIFSLRKNYIIPCITFIAALNVPWPSPAPVVVDADDAKKSNLWT